jgi:hypothetical protein
MRTILKIKMPVETGNAAIKNGSLQRGIGSLMETLKPEAAYFYPEDGKRTALFVFNMQDAAQMPVILEPLFEGLDAAISLTPVMNFEDLQKGLAEMVKHR